MTNHLSIRSIHQETAIESHSFVLGMIQQKFCGKEHILLQVNILRKTQAALALSHTLENV